MLNEQRVARALKRAKSVANETQVVQSISLSRGDRELLVATGWLQEIMRGWYLLVCPDVATGDTAAWYANFWDFISLYFKDRFGEDYCLSAESSLELYTEKTVVPKQLVVMVHAGAGITQLMHGTSLMTYVDKKNFPEKIVKKNGLNVMELPYALCKVSPMYYRKNSREAEIALRVIAAPSDLTRVLAKYNFVSAAGRLIGAYQFLDQKIFANEIQSNLKNIGMRIVVKNPFDQQAPILSSPKFVSPYAIRIQAMWSEARAIVEKVFCQVKEMSWNSRKYLKFVDSVYQFDAYNSLSIEGYQVTDELIECVKSKNWHPDKNMNDLEAKNAMAAKGYCDVFFSVKGSIKQVLQGECSAADIVEREHSAWCQALFGPSVQAGLISADSLFGYRDSRVLIRNSIHSPPAKEAVPDAMRAFFDCLYSEKNSLVKAVLAHYFFVYIHPYSDGNGRMARFIMNVCLVEGGYPWTVIEVKNRKRYIDVLESSHHEFDLKPFASFIKDEMIISLNHYRAKDG